MLTLRLLWVVLLIVMLPQHSCTEVGSPIHKLPLRLSNNYVYYATLGFGSKGQRIEVQLDTGSSTLAVFCDICKDKCVVDQEFMTSLSSSFKNITCAAAKVLAKSLKTTPQALQKCLEECYYSADDTVCKDDLAYGAGALGSYLDYDLVFDFVEIGNSATKALSTFGCIYDEKNFQEGIWGLSFRPSNQLLDGLFQGDTTNGLAARKLFTICTNGKDSVMNIGGIDTTYHVGEGVSLGIDKMVGEWWKLNDQEIGTFTIQKTVIRSTDTSFGRKGIILDSGTDIIILPKAIFIPIRQKIDQFCNQYSKWCSRAPAYEIFDATYSLKNAEEFLGSLPTLDIDIGGKILKTPLSNYFWKTKENTWALGIARAEKYGFQMSILGSIWMNNFDVVFDREQAKITIFDITRCSPSGRQLQTSDDANSDAYELPALHEPVNTYQRLSALKTKHQKSINKMENKN